MKHYELRIKHYALSIALFLLLTACTDHKSGLPTSSGKPYEVLIVAGDTLSVTYLKKTLATAVHGLPQKEPQFDAIACHLSQFDATRKLARSIIVIDENKDLYTKVTVTAERNVYATPQIVIHIQTPDLQALEKDLQGKTGNEILALLNRHEITAQKTVLGRQHNPKAEKRIKEMFGIDMRIPADMQSSKTGKDFLWLSNNAHTGMQNICIFKSENIDSVLKQNIKGETDEMYMKLCEGAGERTNGRIFRGLWEMEGDAMGGPYVARIINSTPQKAPLTVLTFVYAPETTKRNKMRQLEAVLYTIKQP